MYYCSLCSVWVLHPRCFFVDANMAAGTLSDAYACDCCRFHFQCTAIDLRHRSADRRHLDCRPRRLWQSGNNYRLVLYPRADRRAFFARDEGKTAARSRRTIAASPRKVSAAPSVTGGMLPRHGWTWASAIAVVGEAGYPDVEGSRALDGCWTGPAHLRPTSFSIGASWCESTPSAFITALMMQSDRMSSSVGSYCRHFGFIHFLAGCKTTMA